MVGRRGEGVDRRMILSWSTPNIATVTVSGYIMLKDLFHFVEKNR